MAVRGDNSLFFASGIDNSGLQSGIGEATGMIQGLAGSIAAINPFAILATGAVTAFATIATSAYNMMSEFEHAMKEVETISAATQANFKGISAEVFALSKISPDGPAKLAKAYYQIVSAGYDGAQGLKLLETASKAATAGVTTTETAADGITTVLNAFKLEAEEADKVADAMFQTVKLGKTTFEQLSAQLSQVAPLAAASGFSFQEVLAAVATLTKQGTPTAQAMTQIRSALEATTEVLGDGAAKSMTLQNAFQAIYDKAGGSQTELKELTGRMEAMNAILALSGPNAEGAAKDLKALGNSAGSAAEAFNRMAGSNVNEWKILGNRIAATTENIGNSLVEMSSGIAGFMNDALEEGGQLKKNLQDQQVELYKYETAVTDVSEGTDEWKTVRDELMAKFPDMFKGIDKETITTETLLGVLNQVNDAYKERYKLQKREAELRKAVEKEGDTEIKVENTEQQFRDLLYNLKAEAESRGIELELDFNKKPEELIRDIENRLREANQGFLDPFSDEGFAAKPIQNLRGLIPYIEDVTGALIEQQKEVENLEERNKALAKTQLETLAGQRVALEEINKATTMSGLTPYMESGIEAIERAIEARKAIIMQFRAIDQAKDLKSLEPFLNSQLEEVKKYAKERSRYLTVEPGDGGGGDEGKAFAEMLKQREKEYKEYQATIEQLGQEAADKIFASLIEEGKDYGSFLEDQLSKTEDFSKQRAIALAASANNLDLNRGVAESVGNVTPQGIAPVDLDTSSINYYNRQLTRLREERQAARTQARRKEIDAEIAMWEEKLAIAERGAEKEKSIYETIPLELDDLNRKELLKYLHFWQDKLKIAKENSDKIAAEEADAKVGAAKKQIANDTADAMSEVSGSLAEASNMFREFGEEDLANVLSKFSSLSGSISNIVSGVATGGLAGWLQMAGGVMNGLTSLFGGGGGGSSYEKTIEDLRGAIGRLSNEIETAFGTEKIRLSTEQLAKYNEQVSEIKKEIAEMIALRESGESVWGMSVYEIAGGDERLNSLRDSLSDLQAEFADAVGSLGETLTGTTADSITDSIVEGFRNGKRGIEDFAQTFEEMMQETMLNIFKNNFLTARIQEFYKQLSEAANLNGGQQELTPQEIMDLQNQFNDIIEDAQTEFSLLQDLLESAGLDGFGSSLEDQESRTGLAGGITNITEDTANILAGYLNAVRIDLRNSLLINEQSLGHLSEIASNTRYNRFLESIDGRMATIEKGIQEFQAQG